MAAIKIPALCEIDLGGNGVGALKRQKFTIGAASTNDVVLSSQATYAIINMDADDGVMIHEILLRVKTAFTASVTLTVGDGTDADGFYASADIAPQTEVATGLWKSSLTASQPYAGGKIYEADDTIDVVVGGADVAAGQAELIVIYSDGLAAHN